MIYLDRSGFIDGSWTEPREFFVPSVIKYYYYYFIIIIIIISFFSISITHTLHSVQFIPFQSNSVQSISLTAPKPSPKNCKARYQHKKTKVGETRLEWEGGALWGNCHNCHLVSSVAITVRDYLTFGNTAFVF